VEGHALAQVERELPPIFGERPAFGQGWDKVEILVGLDERFIDQLKQAQRRERRLRVGVEAGGVHSTGHDQSVVALRGSGCYDANTHNHDGQDEHKSGNSGQ